MDLLRFAHLFSATWTRTLLGVQQLHPVRAQWVGHWERLTAARLPVSTICSSALSGHTLGPESQKTEQRQPHPEVSVEEEAGEDGFGTLSNKYSSRRMFRKSTAQLYNLRLKELGAEEEEREPEPRVWQGPRNTPYWYFFRCKQLIREGKVRGSSGCSHFCSSSLPGSFWAPSPFPATLLLTPISLPPCHSLELYPWLF